MPPTPPIAPEPWREVPRPGGRVTIPFANRAEAARVLADRLQAYAGREDVIVLGLPRGGVPVAFEVAGALRAPLDLMLVRKLGVPGHEELALGAIATGGVYVPNDDVIDALAIGPATIAQVRERELSELATRERELRGDRPPPRLRGRCVILVDDGLATGSTMRAAIRAARAQGASEIVVAAPVAPRSTVEELRDEADEVVCPAIPEAFFAIGQFYRDFTQVSTQEARAWCERAWRGEGAP